MAVFSLAWALPASFGPWAEGLVLDNYDPNIVWYAVGIICFIAVLGFLLLNQSTKKRFAALPTEELASI